MNIGAALAHLQTILQNFSDAPSLDAQRIILHAIDKPDASFLIAHSEEMLTQEQQQAISTMADQRKTGMPLAYILGEADFYGRTFTVTPDVLIPRPDTETLIEKALEYVQNNLKHTKEIVIADICTGSGIIAITLALELQKLQVTSYTLLASDISPAALAIAQHNAAQHGVADRIEFLQGDLLEPIKNRNVDLIVSNPPYIPSRELQPHSALRATRGKIQTIGLDFEPQIALDGGEDGLKFVNQITAYAQANNIPAIIETVGGEIITVRM